MCSSVVERYVDIVEVASSILAMPTKKVLIFLFNNLFTKKVNEYIPVLPGDYCEGVIPDPIPNSEVKPFSADGTLS